MGTCVLPEALAQLSIFFPMSKAVLSISDSSHLACTSWQMASLYLYQSNHSNVLPYKLPAQALLLEQE